MKTTMRYPLLLALAATLAACVATAPRRFYPPRPFHDDNVARLQVGMPAEAVVALFGAPDTTYAMRFGADTGREWEGVAYRYYVVRDPAYVHVDRWKKNVFYFQRAEDGSLRLNHWSIEHRTEAGKVK